MSNYDHTLSITLPAALLPIAQSISRALDPDVGGSESWSLAEAGDTITTSAPCTAEFYEQAQLMLQHPEALHAACLADYAARWADLVPPTLEECESFCAGAVAPVIQAPQ